MPCICWNIPFSTFSDLLLDLCEEGLIVSLKTNIWKCFLCALSITNNSTSLLTHSSWCLHGDHCSITWYHGALCGSVCTLTYKCSPLKISTHNAGFDMKTWYNMTIRENQLYRKYILFIWIRLYTTITCETISIFQQSRRNKMNNRMLGNNPSSVKSIQFVKIFNNDHQQELIMVKYFKFESISCMVQWL